MNQYTICKYRDVSERDMDLLFIEAFATDKDFVRLFTDKVKTLGKECTVIHAQRSKVDVGLGESDITVIIDDAGVKKALLIEDKIDAPAMKNQHERYLKRGAKGIKEGEYSEFYDFIVCPDRYKENNEEASKYNYYVSYQECQSFFMGKQDVYSQLRYQQISQALETVKPEYKVNINEVAADSFKKYRDYQEQNYPNMKLRNNAEKIDNSRVNGWWPTFDVGVKGMYIIHKTNKNCVDLTISGKGERYEELRIVEKWLHDRGNTDITLEKTGKSVAFRIRTPEIRMYQPFSTWKMGDLKSCFDAICELTDLAAMFSVINKILFEK